MSETALTHNPYRNLEPYLQSRVADNVAQQTWKEGPRTGEVYHTVDLDDCDFSQTPSLESLEEQIVGRFREHRAEYITPGRTFTKDETKRINLAIGEAVATLFFAYHGAARNSGIELAQMFDLEGEGAKYNAFANKIITQGRRTYLGELGRRHGIKGLDISYGASMAGMHEAADLCFVGDGDFEEYSSMALAHHTVTEITPAIIQMGALTCDNARARAGLSKMSGESKRGRSHGAEYVFFWPSVGANPAGRAFRSDAGFELPAVWGIQDTTPLADAGIQIKNGDWGSEKMIDEGVPLEIFTHLWMPPMAVARHAELLTAHGFGHIKVASFPARL